LSDAADPFAVLGLPARFDLTPAQIRRAYLAKAAATHPDAAGGAGGVDTAVLNGARETLEHPHARGEALLALLGGPSAAQDKSLPPGFLQAVMATRMEAAEDLENGGPAARERWRAWAAGKRAEHEARVAALFASGAEAATAIRVELNAWKYVERLIEQLDPAYDGPGDAGAA